MLEGELRDAFGDLFNTVGRDKLIPARLGVKRSASTVDVVVPGNPKELYITLGINGEDGQGTAIDGVGVDISFGWQEIRVRRELNKWVIYRATHYGAGSGSGPTTLDELTDVDTAGATDGDLLSYDSSTGEWIPFTPTGTTGTAPSPHALFGEHHTAAPLDDSQGPQFLLIDGSRDLEGNLNVLPTVMIDGVDISAHAIGNPNAHHNAATAGNTGITVSASPTQLVSLNLEDTAPGLQIDATGVRVKNFTGIERTASGIGILIKPGVTALKVDGTGLYLDDALAGTGLSINSTTKVLTVNPGDGLKLDIPNDDVEVDKAHNFIWTGTHRFDALTTFNNNAHFMGAARSVTSDSALNLTPSGDLFLAPIANIPLTRQVKVRNNIPINSENFQDLVTGIDGLHFWQPTDGVNQWQLNINAIKVDQLFVRVFTIDETRLARGQEYWSKSFGIVETSFNLPADEATVDVWFEDVPDLPIEAPLFDAGDWLMIRTIDMAAGYLAIAVWFTVVDGDATGTNDWILREDAVAPTATSNGHGPRQKWRLKRENGGATGLLIRKGVVVLDAGTIGTAWIHLNALTGNLGSSGPYIQMGLMDSIAASDVPVHKNRIRIGNLKDVAGFSSTVYGMAAGNDLSIDPEDGLFTGFTIEDVSGLRLYNTDLKIYTGSSPVLTLTQSEGLNFQQDTAYQANDNRYISWYQNLSTLTEKNAVIASFNISDRRYLDIHADGAAPGKTGIVQIHATDPDTASDASILLASDDYVGAPTFGGSSIRMEAKVTTILGKVELGDGSLPPSSIFHIFDTNVTNDEGAGINLRSSNNMDSVMHFKVIPSNVIISMGIDNSDNDKFMICEAASLSASTAFFIYDPTTNTVTIPGISSGGGGTGVVTLAEGEGITIIGTDPAIISVNDSVVRTDRRVDSGAGLIGGGALTANLMLDINNGPGIGFSGDQVIVQLHATAPGLNTTAGLQLDSTVAGDGLEFVGTTRVMQASLGNGLVFTGTTPARDITIKLRTLSPGSGLSMDADGLRIQRRGSSGNESGISMTTTDGIYLSDSVAGAGLEWSDSTNRFLQLSLGGGLEYNDLVGATSASVRVMLPANSGILRDATGIYLNPALAGNGLLMTAGEIDIVPSATGGLVVTANDISIKRRTVGAGSGLNTSTDGLHIQRRNSSGNDSGITMTIADGIYLADNVANQGLEWTGTPERFLRLKLAGGLEFSSTAATASVRVDLGFNYPWTANHTFGTAGLFRVDSIAQFNNNINFMSARTITSSGNLTVNPTGNLTFTPTGELVLNPAGTVTLFTAKTFATSSHTDTPTAITGMWVYDRGANEYHMNITSLKMDELHTRVFVADEVRVDRGEEYWSKSFGIVEEEFDLPLVGNTADVWFENSPALSEIAPNLFSAGDWLLMRTVDTSTGMIIRKIWFTVISLVTAGTAANKRQRWRLEKMTGGAGTTGRVRKGTFMLDAGQVGQGWVHLLAYKEMGGPYIQVGDFDYVSGGTTPVFTNRVRMGNLNGVAGITGTFWGFAAGNDLSQSPSSGGFNGFTVGKGIGSPGTNYDGFRIYNTDIASYNSGVKEFLIPSEGGIRLLQGGNTYQERNSVAWYTNVDSDSSATISLISSTNSVTGERSFVLQNPLAPTYLTSMYFRNRGQAGDVEVKMIGTATLSYLEVEAPDYIFFNTPKLSAGNIVPVSTLHVYESTTAVGVTAGQTIQQAGTGDAVLQFLLKTGSTEVQRYVLGIDNSDGDKLKVTYSADLNSSPVLIYDPATDGVGIGRTPGAGIKLHVNGSTMTPTIQGTTASNGDITIEGTSSATKTTSHVLLQPTGGLVGIGTLTPLTLFSISADGASATISAASYGTTFAAQLILYSANGTEAVPLPTVSGDLIGQIVFQGWDTARSTGASIRATASANWGTAADDTDNPTNLSFWTTPDGFSVQEERFTILSNGNIGIEQPAPAFKLDVTGTLNATGAVTFGSSLAIAGALSGVTNLAIAGTLTGVTNLTMSGALTGATALTAATITANTTFIGNTFAARTAAGLSINDSSGNLAIFVESGGFVGINSTDPLNRFEVIETTLNAGVANFVVNADDGVTIRGMTFRNSDQTAASIHGLRFDFTDSSGGITRGGSLAFGKEQLFTSTGSTKDAFMSLFVAVDGALTERLRITSTGRFGFNTSTPGENVIGTHDLSSTPILHINGATPRLVLTGSTDASLDLIDQGSGSGLKWLQMQNSAGVTVFRSLTDVGAYTKDNILTLEHSSGAIGVGTATPRANNSTSLFTVFGSTTGTHYISIENSQNGQVGIVLERTATSAGRWVLYMPTGSDQLNLYNTASNQDVMSLLTSGYVGINQSTPENWLDVHGEGSGISIIRATAYGNGTSLGFSYIARRATGTKASPTGVATGNVLLSLGAMGRAGNSGGGTPGWLTSPSAEMYVVATQDFDSGTTGKGGAEMQFWTRLNGAASSSKRVTIQNDGALVVPYIAATVIGSGTAVLVDSAGILGKQSSSLRYKEDVQDVDLERHSNLFDSLRPVTYRIKGDSKPLAGLIAEELNAAGGHEFINYDKEGRPDSIAYDRLIVLLISKIRRLERRLM